MTSLKPPSHPGRNHAGDTDLSHLVTPPLPHRSTPFGPLWCSPCEQIRASNLLSWSNRDPVQDIRGLRAPGQHSSHLVHPVRPLARAERAAGGPACSGRKLRGHHTSTLSRCNMEAPSSNERAAGTGSSRDLSRRMSRDLTRRCHVTCPARGHAPGARGDPPYRTATLFPDDDRPAGRRCHVTGARIPRRPGRRRLSRPASPISWGMSSFPPSSCNRGFTSSPQALATGMTGTWSSAPARNPCGRTVTGGLCMSRISSDGWTAPTSWPQGRRWPPEATAKFSL